jgi:recombinational DNA repair protein (RecF pathway)
MSYCIYDTPALVMKRWPQREANSSFLLYTRELGRILARAQSIRKVTSKLAPALQVGSLSSVSLVRGRGGWRLVGAAAKRALLLSSSASKQIVIERFLRLLARLVPEQATDRDLYYIISHGLQAVADSESADDLRSSEYLLVLRTLVQLGYAPDPEARELEPFIQSADYSARVMAAFAPLTTQAVGQINQSLETIQL